MLQPSHFLHYARDLLWHWARVQFPTQAWLHDGIASVFSQAAARPSFHALLFFLSPALIALGTCRQG